MKNENYLLNLHKIIPLWYEDVHAEVPLELYQNITSPEYSHEPSSAVA